MSFAGGLGYLEGLRISGGRVSGSARVYPWIPYPLPLSLIEQFCTNTSATLVLIVTPAGGALVSISPPSGMTRQNLPRVPGNVFSVRDGMRFVV